MLTEADIKNQLKMDPHWEPDEDVSDDEWELFEETKEKMEKNKDSDDATETKDKKDDDTDWPYGSEDDQYKLKEPVQGGDFKWQKVEVKRRHQLKRTVEKAKRLSKTGLL